MLLSWNGLNSVVLLLIVMAFAPTAVSAQDGELPPLMYDKLLKRLDELESEVSRLKTAPAPLPTANNDPNHGVQRTNSEYLPPAPGYFSEAG